MKLALLTVLLTASVAGAEVRLPHVLSSNMVFQREKPARVWGWANPGEFVRVTQGTTTLSATASPAGQWEVLLPPSPAGPVADITVAGSSNTLTLSNLLAGDVYLCAGQSNMGWNLAWTSHAKADIAAANYPNTRVYKQQTRVSHQPKSDTDGAWHVCSPATAGSFSALGYLTARDLHTALDVPIAVVQASIGGVPIDGFISRERLASNELTKNRVHVFENYQKDYSAIRARYEAALAKWKADPNKPESAKPPAEPALPDNYPNSAGVIYNGMIHPFTPLSLKGVVWYQGEHNISRGYQYRTQLPMMIQFWRDAFAQPDLPFVVVQLPEWKARQCEPVESDQAELREAQSLTAESLPNVGNIITLGLGDASDPHPRDKTQVARRAANWLLEHIYRRTDIEGDAPTAYRDAIRFAGNTVTIPFLHSAGLTTTDGGSPKGFAVAGEDRVFHWATAALRGSTVTLTCPAVPKPVAVRYAWADNPEFNLVSKEGLPAAPFRSDDWPGKTFKAR